jgi:hypothetical protein
MVAHEPTPLMIRNEITGATILFGRSPYGEPMIRYHVTCNCGASRLELIASPESEPEDYLWAARDYHLDRYPDCLCMETERDLTAYWN